MSTLVKTWNTENPTSRAPMVKNIPWREYVDAGPTQHHSCYYLTPYLRTSNSCHFWHIAPLNCFIVLNVTLEDMRCIFTLAHTHTYTQINACCFFFFLTNSACYSLHFEWFLWLVVVIVQTSASVWQWCLILNRKKSFICRNNLLYYWYRTEAVNLRKFRYIYMWVFLHLNKVRRITMVKMVWRIAMVKMIGRLIGFFHWYCLHKQSKCIVCFSIA